MNNNKEIEREETLSSLRVEQLCKNSGIAFSTARQEVTGIVEHNRFVLDRPNTAEQKTL